MPRLLYASIGILFLSLSLISQNRDTIYFDKTWKNSTKQESVYYRLIDTTSGYYIIQDYYNSGILQMRATAKNLEPEILDGKASYYYPNGFLQSSGIYRNNKPVGIWDEYNKKGRLVNSYNYGSGIIDSANIKAIEFKKYISEKDKIFSLALRGKLFGFFIIEDTYFSTTTLGAELLFKGRHSLGIDFTYFGWQYERDDSNDNPLYETYERRTYVYFDYKYRIFSFRYFDFYFNLYDKLGTYHLWHEGVAEGYNFWDKPFLSDKINGTFNQVGIGLGFKKYVTDRFYIDFNVNGGKQFSNDNTMTYNDSTKVSVFNTHVRNMNNTFYMRLNLAYKIYIKHDEKVFYEN